jgi:hypothetical protein
MACYRDRFTFAFYEQHLNYWIMHYLFSENYCEMKGYVCMQ